MILLHAPSRNAAEICLLIRNPNPNANAKPKQPEFCLKWPRNDANPNSNFNPSPCKFEGPWPWKSLKNLGLIAFSFASLCFDLEEENESNNSGVKGRAESICVGSSEWEVTLVEFYSPKCRHCNSLLKYFSKVETCNSNWLNIVMADAENPNWLPNDNSHLTTQKRYRQKKGWTTSN
ncbi:hypothetical protein HKD37_10G029140 [Glycine soja]